MFIGLCHGLVAMLHDADIVHMINASEKHKTLEMFIDHSNFVRIYGDPAYHCMCSMQVVDITPMKHRLTSITSIRVVQRKHRRSKVCL
jgi:hypothetical protein